MPRVMLITKADRAKLLANGRDRDRDHLPVVKIFNPYGNQTWLISEMDPENPDLLFGLCDLGFGSPELGTVLLSELENVEPRPGLHLERESLWMAKYAMSHYRDEARTLGHIKA